jgi:hypothetical protein
MGRSSGGHLCSRCGGAKNDCNLFSEEPKRSTKKHETYVPIMFVLLSCGFVDHFFLSPFDSDQSLKSNSLTCRNCLR